MFKRALTYASNGVPQPMRAGDGLLGNIRIETISADAAATLTVAQIAGGMVQFTGFTAGRNITTPTAALILAANPGMDVGDSFSFIVSITPAFAGTWVAGTGVTLAGRATTPASSWSVVTVTKTGAAAVTWNVS